MMNSIYDFSKIEEIRIRQKRIVLEYLVCSLCFVALLLLVCAFIDNNLVLTVVFALLLFIFILYSIVLFKVKYAILKEYRAFLENMELGMKSDYVGRFVFVEPAKTTDPFDEYVFVSSNKETRFLIHNQHSVELLEGEEYRIELVGRYVYRWIKYND